MFDTETSTKRLAAIIRGTMYSDKHKDMARQRIESLKVNKPKRSTFIRVSTKIEHKSSIRHQYTLFIPPYGLINMPKDIYKHKHYPTCTCGRKFVPVFNNNKECFFCQFNKK